MYANIHYFLSLACVIYNILIIITEYTENKVYATRHFVRREDGKTVTNYSRLEPRGIRSGFAR